MGVGQALDRGDGAAAGRGNRGIGRKLRTASIHPMYQRLVFLLCRAVLVVS